MPRPNPIQFAAFLVQFAALCSVAAAQNRGNGAAAGQADRPAAPKMTTEDLLRQWEGQSQRLKDLSVAIYRVDKSLDWEDELHYEGSAQFKTPQLAYLDFRKVKTKVMPDPKEPKKNKLVDLIDPKTKSRISQPYERIVCTGPEVWHYRFDKNTAYIYPLNKQAQRRGLDEGPVPFLFNMKAEDAMTRYVVSLQGEDKDTYLVAIKPKLKEDQESFSTAWIRLDRRYLLPVRITLISPDKQSIRDFKLSRIAANQGVEDGVFRGVKYKGMTIERNPAGVEEEEAERQPRRRNPIDNAQRLRGFDNGQPR